MLYGIPCQDNKLSGEGGWIGSGVDTPDSKNNISANERPLPAHFESAIGAYRALLEEHLPLDIITEQDLEADDTLAQYKALILPNAACLSDAMLGHIRKYVENGGGLLSTHEASRCDEYGTPRPDFGLSDLFRASFVTTDDFTARWPEYPKSTYLAPARHEITSDPVISDNMRRDCRLLNYIGMTTSVNLLDGASVLMNQGQKLIPDSIENPYGLFASCKDPAVHPFLIVSNHGKGRVAYFAGDIAQTYFRCPYAYQRKLIANALKWSAASLPEIQVKAPLCVQTTFFEQTIENRCIIHLLNEVNTVADRALPENNSSSREEVLPIHGIEITTNLPVSKAWLEPEHAFLPITTAEGQSLITVPKLEMHSMVVLEKA